MRILISFRDPRTRGGSLGGQKRNDTPLVNQRKPLLGALLSSHRQQESLQRELELNRTHSENYSPKEKSVKRPRISHFAGNELLLRFLEKRTTGPKRKKSQNRPKELPGGGGQPLMDFSSEVGLRPPIIVSDQGKVYHEANRHQATTNLPQFQRKDRECTSRDRVWYKGRQKDCRDLERRSQPLVAFPLGIIARKVLGRVSERSPQLGAPKEVAKSSKSG